MNVTFFGVRGSTPCASERTRRYGGNTACVAIEQKGSDPVLLDLGTGLRFLGETQPQDGSFRGHALVTHLHWDHVQGLPFFLPLHHRGARLDVYGPRPEDCSLATAFDRFMNPPYFPVSITDLPGEVHFHEVDDTELAVGDAKVVARPVPHIGATNGYRVIFGDVVVVYISDHQQPRDGSFVVADEVLELCDGADLLIHDAQFTPEQFAAKPHWGHCTIEYALAVAAEAGVRRVALFHHDPGHDDDAMDRLLGEARLHRLAGRLDEVLAAQEGLTIAFEGAGQVMAPGAADDR